MRREKKTKPALWTTLPDSAERVALLDRARQLKRDILRAERRCAKLKATMLRRLAKSRALPAEARTYAARFRGANARGLLRAAYNRRAKEWLKGKMCACCVKTARTVEDHYRIKDATEVHHKHGRGWRGELLLAEDLWLPLCGRCHRWVHDNPEAARAAGMLAPAGEWNRRPA